METTHLIPVHIIVNGRHTQTVDVESPETSRILVAIHFGYKYQVILTKDDSGVLSYIVTSIV